MEKQLSIVGALTHRLLKEHRSPVISLYDIGIATVQMYETKEYAGQKIKNLRSPLPRRDAILKYRNELILLGVLEERKDFPSDCSLLTSSPFKETLDFACSIDPFCYASHLSAMEYHGLTDRFAKTVFLTTLPSTVWRQRAGEKMRKDLGEEAFAKYSDAGFPLLTRHELTSLNKHPLHIFATRFSDQGAYIVSPDRPIRVTSIGRTFLDMLRKPDLCGGITHVLDVYREHARAYQHLIISEVDRHGDKIDKVRAGYILEELCGIKDHPKIESWVQFAQRGGSRVLDASTPYWSTFSEKWCLSINVPI